MLSGLHRAAPPLGAVRRLTALLLLVGAVAQLGFLAELVVDTALSPWHVAPARLAAESQPHHDVFRLADWIAGGALVLAGPPLLRLAPVHRYGRLTVATMCVFGLFLLTRAAFPPDCVATPSALCGPGSDAAVVPPVLLPGGLYVVSPLVLAAWWPGPWRTCAWVLLAVQSGAWTLMIVGSGWLDGRFVGLAARSQILAASALLVAGAVYVLDRRLSRGASSPTRNGASEKAVSCRG